MNRKIRIMLVEDHPGYREVIARTLKSQSDIELISQFGTAEIALRTLQDKSRPNVPDLILLDLNLPGLSGLEALPLFIKHAPETKIIVLTQSDRKEDVLTAISRGVSGYLLKSATAQQIKDGIHTVMNGGASLDPGMAKHILDAMKTRTPVIGPNKVLTERELEVLALLGEGLLKKEIADRLDISVSTVIDHVRHIYERLSVQNAPSAVHKAHRLGLFSPDDTTSGTGVSP
jgi:DNA-binding NarL/FixJ family response regulator